MGVALGSLVCNVSAISRALSINISSTCVDPSKHGGTSTGPLSLSAEKV